MKKFITTVCLVIVSLNALSQNINDWDWQNIAKTPQFSIGFAFGAGINNHSLKPSFGGSLGVGYFRFQMNCISSGHNIAETKYGKGSVLSTPEKDEFLFGCQVPSFYFGSGEYRWVIKSILMVGWANDTYCYSDLYYDKRVADHHEFAGYSFCGGFTLERSYHNVISYGICFTATPNNFLLGVCLTL